MTKHYDLIVVGGGVLGTFHAYHALEKGLSVALIDKNHRPQGSSVQNFGQIVPSGMNQKWQAYGRKSLEIYQSLQNQFDIGIRQNGSVYLASNEEEMTLLEELAQQNRHNDYPSQLLTAAECLAKYEGLRADYCVGGLFFPQELTAEPRSTVARIQDYLAEQKGLDLFPNTLVVDIEENDRGCKVTSSNRAVFSTEKVLVCSGYEFKTLFPNVFAQSNLELVKLQMLLLESQPTQRLPGSILTGWTIRRYESFHECPSWAAIKAREDTHSFQRKWGVHILFKQALDGSVILGDSHEYAEVHQEEQLGGHLREDLNRFMLDEAARIFDLQNWSVRETWAGMYAQSKTSDVFQHTIQQRIHILTGIGGKGMTGSAGFAAEHLHTII